MLFHLATEAFWRRLGYNRRLLADDLSHHSLRHRARTDRAGTKKQEATDADY
jgi:hypothetical protein